MAHASHVVVDQLGYLGSNLFFPFRSKRVGGLKLTHSQDPFWNFAAVWLSWLLVYWNLHRLASVAVPSLSVVKLFFYGAAVPAAAYALVRRIVARTRRQR
jgi:hypothetical protein